MGGGQSRWNVNYKIKMMEGMGFKNEKKKKEKINRHRPEHTLFCTGEGCLPVVAWRGTVVLCGEPAAGGAMAGHGVARG